MFQKEREIITRTPYTDSFDFDEIKEFITGASKNLFISHKFKNNKKILVQPRGGFPTYDKVFELYGEFTKAGVDVLPLTIDSNTRLNDYEMAKKCWLSQKRTTRTC